MLDSDKECCTILANLLIAKGVKRIVLSPGSRNAPLIVSFARRKEFEKFVVLDERSAAFMAMGIAQQSGEPVAVVCTSGTALLNYAPAVAEAYYQHIPLIVISADRLKNGSTKRIARRSDRKICSPHSLRHLTPCLLKLLVMTNVGG